MISYLSQPVNVWFPQYSGITYLPLLPTWVVMNLQLRSHALQTQDKVSFASDTFGSSFVRANPAHTYDDQNV